MLYAVTKVNSVDVRSLRSCTVCVRVSLSPVCMCVWSSCPGEMWTETCRGKFLNCFKCFKY